MSGAAARWVGSYLPLLSAFGGENSRQFVVAPNLKAGKLHIVFTVLHLVRKFFVGQREKYPTLFPSVFLFPKRAFYPKEVKVNRCLFQTRHARMTRIATTQRVK